MHHVILLPGLDEAEELAHRLEAVGNLHSDGRPILGMDSRDLLQMTMDACPDAIFIPAHIWTPHFSVFGEFSQFSTLEECYGDMTGCIHALETGLSSDPPMNRRVSQLDSYLLVSNSDAHSPQKLGREANLLSCGATYGELKHALETGEGFEGTIEFYPEEGKYHLDGHRACGCCLEPEETNALNGRCPVCGRKLTVGVLHRVDELADRREPGPLSRPFESLMPLPELLANCMQTGASSKRVQGAYLEMLKRYGPEFTILRELPLEAAERDMGHGVAEALRRLRTGQVHKQAGYDGEYGVITVFEPHELELLEGQTSLLELAGFAAPKAKKQPVKARTAEAESEEMVQKLPLRMNPEQEEAIRAEDEIIAVVAGPGTGKTRTLVERIASSGGAAEGAAEGDHRRHLYSSGGGGNARPAEGAAGAAAKSITIGTFHAIALNLLEKKPLFSREQALALMAELLEERGEKTSPAEMLRLLSQEKNGMEVVGFPHGLREAYDERMHELGARDLDDLLTEALALDVSRKPCFRHLLVDEFQDINPLQHRLVEHWRQGSLFVIGDPDQSI
ncbi:MAG: UvrD-helicase domain-containing protein [Lachnospiraceae bacterium]